MARGERNRSSAADMLRSLAVIVIPILLVGALLTNRIEDYPNEPVEVAPVLDVAREQAPWPVLAPTALPSGWTPIRVGWTPTGRPALDDQPSPRNRWLVGYLDPTQTYLSLEQGDGDVAAFVLDVSRDGRPDGASTVAGEQWERRVSPDQRTRSLVLLEAESAAVVSGDVDYPELEAFAATLDDGG